MVRSLVVSHASRSCSSSKPQEFLARETPNTYKLAITCIIMLEWPRTTSLGCWYDFEGLNTRLEIDLNPWVWSDCQDCDLLCHFSVYQPIYHLQCGETCSQWNTPVSSEASHRHQTSLPESTVAILWIKTYHSSEWGPFCSSGGYVVGLDVCRWSSMCENCVSLVLWKCT